MSVETYENLMRAIEKRLMRARITGRAVDIAEACLAKQKLIQQYKDESK